MIRPATIEDLPRMGSAANAFYESSRHLRGFDLARFTDVWTKLLNSGMGMIFIMEHAGEIDGAIGGMVYPDINSGELTATEFFWFVKPNSRGPGMRLYKLFEEWALKQGCYAIRMVHLVDLMPEKLARIYERWGYQPTEVHYVKEIY